MYYIVNNDNYITQSALMTPKQYNDNNQQTILSKIGVKINIS